MSVLVGEGLAKSYGDHDVFVDIHLRVEHGDRIGLVGPNGSGKTTLLRILAGLESPDAGTVRRARSIRVGYLPQDAPVPREDRTLWADLEQVFAPLLAQAEALRALEARMTEPGLSEAQMDALLAEYGAMQEAFEQAGGYAIDHRIRSVLMGLGLPEELWHRPLAHLSGGQRTRALLARLLLEEPPLLLLDEPTNHLDVAAVEWLEQQLLAWKGALVVVSHDRYFLDTVVTRIWELTHGRLDVYRGDYSHYRRQREERLAHWRAEYARQQRFIQETQEFIRRYRAGQRSKEARGRETRLRRFLETEALPPPPQEQRIRLPLQAATRSGERVLYTRRLVVGYRLAGDNGTSASVPVLEVPDLELRRGQVVALLGPNGAGKTTLVRTFLGELEPLQGTVRLGVGVEVGYLPQRHDRFLDPGRTVLDTVLDVRNMPVGQARSYLAQFLFRGEEVFQRVGSLSGGQRSRLALACLTLRGANFLVLDEPTNHLDLDSQEILEDALRRFDGTVLLVTHDRALVDALATELWWVMPGTGSEPGRLEVFRGTWRQWLQERAREGADSLDGAAPGRRPTAQDGSTPRSSWEDLRAERRRRQAERKRQQALQALEDRIHGLEQRLEQLDMALAAAGQAQDLARIQALEAERRTLERRLEQEMDHWTALAEAVETT